MNPKKELLWGLWVNYSTSMFRRMSGSGACPQRLHRSSGAAAPAAQKRGLNKGFRALGFRGLGFRVWAFRVQGFRGLGFRGFSRLRG